MLIDVVQSNLNIYQNKTLKDSLHEALKETIVLGQVPAGTRINEKELSDALNISRTPIRHALERLESEQLVERKHGRGVIVRGISQSDAREIFSIRKALDTLATVTAAKNMNEKDFHDLQLLLQDGDNFYNEGLIDELLENFKEFNDFIYEKSEMSRLPAILKELKEYLFYFRDISIRSDERAGPALNDHWKIYEGMKNKNWESLEEIIHQHLKDSEDYILEEMERREID